MKKTATTSIRLLIPLAVCCSGGHSSAAASVPGIATAATSPQLLCRDWQTAQVGSYLVQNNVWGKGNITGYSQCVGIGPREGRSVAARWTWNWLNSGSNVKGYPEIIFGRKPGHASTTAALPRQVKTINAATVSFDYASTHSGRGNSAFDLWLSRGRDVTPGSKIEVMVWLDWWGGMMPAHRYLTSASIDGRDYDLFVGTGAGQPYLAYRMKSPLVGSGSLNMRFFMDHLKSIGLLTGDEYLQSIEFGNEACNGSGDTSLYSYSVVIR
jgi:hypothetical protein